MTHWSPVIYGRTHRVDRWWRAWPANLPRQNWADGALLGVVNNGRDLVSWTGEESLNAPRYLLARGRNGVLVGVACRARMLSETRHLDAQGPRELYCFVGWFGTDSGTVDIPSLAELSTHAASWTGEAYERFMGPVWTLDGDQFDVERTVPEVAPWPPPVREKATHGLPCQPHAVHWFPQSRADDLWESAIQTQAEFALTTGWQSDTITPREHLTHLCVEGLTAELTIALPKPQPPPTPPRSYDSDNDPSIRDRFGHLVGGIKSHLVAESGNRAARLDSWERRDLTDASKRAKKADERASEAELRARQLRAEADQAKHDLDQIKKRLNLLDQGAGSQSRPPPQTRLPQRQKRADGEYFDTWGDDQ